MTSTDYFITARSFAAPFFSDTSTAYVHASSPTEALAFYAANYSHPAGLYAAECWDSADSYHRGEDFLAQWLSNHARVMKEETKDPDGAYMLEGMGPGRFKIDGRLVVVDDPTDGRVVVP